MSGFAAFAVSYCVGMAGPKSVRLKHHHPLNPVVAVRLAGRQHQRRGDATACALNLERVRHPGVPHEDDVAAVALPEVGVRLRRAAVGRRVLAGGDARPPVARQSVRRRARRAVHHRAAILGARRVAGNHSAGRRSARAQSGAAAHLAALSGGRRARVDVGG